MSLLSALFDWLAKALAFSLQPLAFQCFSSPLFDWLAKGGIR